MSVCNPVNEVLMMLVRDRIARDWRLAAQAIDVCCSEGCVALIGRVESHEQRSLAIELARGTMGVCSVRDELEVRALGPPASHRAP